MKEPEGVYTSGIQICNIKDIPGWFDYSLERILPANSVGMIYKVEKMDADLQEVLYCVRFEGFGYVNIKHCDLKGF